MSIFYIFDSFIRNGNSKRVSTKALKLYDIPEDETPKLYVSEGIEAKDIYLVTKD